MKPGRIETYIHSDNVTENKGICVVTILCETDFAAKTQEFIDHCKYVAKFCYAYDYVTTQLIYIINYEFDQSLSQEDLEFLSKHKELTKNLKEKITYYKSYLDKL